MEFIIIVVLVIGILILHKPLSVVFNRLYIKRQQRKFVDETLSQRSFQNIRYYNCLGLKTSANFYSAHFYSGKPGAPLYRSKRKC
jgi:hypothetical protein